MSHIPEAASVVLARSAGLPEVLVVRRSEGLRFFGGYLAFPGGRVGAEDATVDVWSGGAAGRDPRRAAAARELFEETGVLLARQADGALPADTRAWGEQRRALQADRLSFGRFLAEEGLHLHAEDFLPAGSLVTPPFSPVRFATAFFVAALPPGQQAEVWPGELESGFWTSAEDLLGRWTRGECLVSPPTVSILQLLRGRPAVDLPGRLAPLLARLETGALPPIYFAPGVQMIPLRTLGLPPSTYTNAYLVGSEALYLIDPGAHEVEEQQRLFDAVDERLAEGGRLRAVVLTHHHPDHVGAAAACAGRWGVPVLAHPRTAALLRGQVEVSGTIGEGDRLEMGVAPDGGGPWHLETLHTPGHASGHLAFYEPRYRFLFAGDLVSLLSTVVIAPPDGDLGLYLQSLQRLRGLDCRVLLPGHGGPSVRPRQVLDEYLAHRVKREGQLLEALAAGGPQTPAELVSRLYPDLAEGLWGLARLQVLAGLEKLSREGRAAADSSDGEPRWSVRSPVEV